MNNEFVCRVMNEDELLGTAFLVKKNVAFTALHTLKNFNNESIYISFDFPVTKKYFVKEVLKVKALDIAQILLEDDINYDSLPNISIEGIDNEDDLITYGYPNNNRIYMTLDYHEKVYNGAADYSLMVKNEEDRARWYGISGAPLICDKLISGVILKNYGGDGLKTRLKVVSFNKIVTYLVDNKIDEVLQNIPQNFTSSQLYQRMMINKDLCQQLYICAKHRFDEIKLNINLHFMRVNNKKEIDISKYNEKIEEAMQSYSVMLDDLYGKYTDDFATIIKRGVKINERMSKVKARLNRENTGLIILWILSEGILNTPRVGRFLAKRGNNLYEQDLYFKREEEKVTLVIPFVSIYEELLESIENILKSIDESISAQTGLVDYNSIEWDGQAVGCMDYKSQMIINKILNKKYGEKLDIEITSLIIYNTEMYDDIPEVAIDNDSRTSAFFKDKFLEEFKKDEKKYSEMFQIYDFINSINLNLFVIPFSAISDIDTFNEESR
ncbi:hypothetical protein [Clostridium estertheticum]|uniref:hypothetical protein n=1 Tax=Clostridium estertheticum TaxID=238834 RepID=UPI001C0B6BAF|nr:hypothetical protein [Clostridium estertheticum]MBU3075689.1 hypothetical protein [Clostridium estertheticum]MBU3165801.1 hypothetical protein [Clostridium estertheticum]